MNNLYRFRRLKWGEPTKLKMLPDTPPRRWSPDPVTVLLLVVIAVSVAVAAVML